MGEEMKDGAVARLNYRIEQVKICKQSANQPQIRRVYEQLREVSEKDYEPEIVSIGPIHRGEVRLEEMEQFKVWYLSNFVQRRPKISIEECVKKLREIEEQARQCYSNVSSWCLDGDEFVVMLLLDGCFVIELVRKYWFKDPDNDPLFESDHTLCQIRRDLLLLENQIPFFVLNLLFDMTKTSTNDPEEDLQHLVIVFVFDILPWTSASKSDSRPDADHLLGLIYQSCFSFSTKNLTNGYTGNNNSLQIRSASELREAGIRLKESKGNLHINSDLAGRRARRKGGIHINSASELKRAGISLKPSKDNSLTFDNGVLKLPPFQVSGKTESVLRNLMAYEQLRPNKCHQPKHVTDYVFFMHCLIRSTKDVEALRRSGVLGNYLGGDDRVYHLLDRLVNNVLRSSEFCHSDVFEKLNSHCSDRREKWMARLWRDYFNSPWSLASFVAAAVLLGVSIMQLTFTILTYMHQLRIWARPR